MLRDRASAWDRDTLFAVFGPDTENASEHAGAVQVGDAKLLLLPVRSLYGVFALVASPYLLERFRREALMAGLQPPGVPGLQDPTRVLLAPGSRLLGDGEKVYLEDLDLKAQGEEGVAAWERWLAERTEAPVLGRLAVVHDDLMGFLLETATEVVARIRLDDETKTVAKGALWYEESLPAESLLYALVRADRSFRKGKELPPEGVWALFRGVLEEGGGCSSSGARPPWAGGFAGSWWGGRPCAPARRCGPRRPTRRSGKRPRARAGASTGTWP